MKLVSIIIPCFNAERWLPEAIDSCLRQTYPHLEIIVIDDGSSDRSLEIIRSYGDKIRWETGPNCGGCAARNRGFALSTGDYIQYLDADDYLLPEKIASQVAALEDSGADVVYGDWRYQKHLADGQVVLDAVQVGGPKADFLEALLSDAQWLAPMALLLTRSAVVQSGGWDPQLKTGQDRDFLISVALAGASFHYRPGCASVYRRYGNVTVSTVSKTRWRDGHFALMEKAETRLSQLGRLSQRYRQALAHSYYGKIRADRHRIDRAQYCWALEKIVALDPAFVPTQVRPSYTALQKILGFEQTERLLRLCKTVLRGD
jgi:glycosyltransferase involved in cell wall biosynthesis